MLIHCVQARPRARGLSKGAVFPGGNLLDHVHAVAQAVWDLRRLLPWIRSQEPDSPVGLNGMSLGGYITSLVASLDGGLACAILGVPVADLVDLLGRHAGLSHNAPRRASSMTWSRPWAARRPPPAVSCAALSGAGWSKVMTYGVRPDRRMMSGVLSRTSLPTSSPSR